MSKFNALIIGAGKIGAFFDDPSSKNITTHAHAYLKHRAFKLVGFVDVNKKMGERAANLWGGSFYPSINDAFSHLEKIDVVSVCVPDDLHYQVLKDLSNKKVKLVFAEKPITKSIKDAKEIIKIYSQSNISLTVNYSRRFVPELTKLKRGIDNGKYGKFISGTGVYGKGIMHNGSHLIDLIRMLVGEVNEVSNIDKQNDFYKDDPSVSAVLKIDKAGYIVIQTVDCKNYTIFELDLLFQKGRIRITDSARKIEKYSIVHSNLFKGYKYLNLSKLEKSSLDRSIYFAVDNIYKHLDGGDNLLCGGEDAYLDLATSIDIKGSK